jgi:predicted DsbA family dithiol-disulfide isomerase
VLRTGELAPAVRADIDAGLALGLAGVPFYVIDGRYGLSGAQPVEVFVRALDELTRPAIRIA